MHRILLGGACLAFLLLSAPVDAILPAGILQLSMGQASRPAMRTDMLVAPSSQSGWGPQLPSNDSTYYPILFSSDGCSALSSDYKNSYVVMDRGNCSFLDKAKHASDVGAAAVIIRNTREAVYFVDRNRSSTGNLSDVAMTPSFATDCSQGESYIPALDPTTPWLVPNAAACSANPSCTSQICIPTGIQSPSRGFQVCCMWDTHLLMGVNYTLYKQASLQLPIVFATVGQGENLTAFHATYPSAMTGSLVERPMPLFGTASIVLWLLGIFTAWGGAYYAARTERLQQLAAKPHAHADDDIDDEVLDVSFRHAIYFVVFAGLFLTFLYFVHVGPMLSIMFGLSAVSTFTALVTQPLCHHLLCCLHRAVLRVPVAGVIPLPDLLATAATTALVVLWYLHRATFWYLQDAFGIALCFVFLKTIRLPTLQVATVLLTLAFVYDIFFVFVTPLIFGRSVMVDVATGGPSASSKADYPGSDFCERYPTYAPCVDPEPLPMLLVFPRLFDWRGGQAMLGLGDIVLPGLLLCFALRFDYAREVYHKQSDVVFHRYYVITCVGYTVGLFAANVAVVLMEMGQPALLYLVPCTLGGIAVAAYASGDLHQMWHYGPYPVHPVGPSVASPIDLEHAEKSPFLHE
ncbi:Aste57867_10341 [Aphanomyces stellatus]|uniref:Aste57867_10341 protein n=1 Tax=Aphanomyces stellatus TaxID=120398 RepID=A0A485KQL7_9STRA|nr:hypothetical protein As57867_010301 [Aphanomyces stellatus]VFT87215.1 Aste57867_10341 [Aphanomyces stellatus]